MNKNTELNVAYQMGRSRNITYSSATLAFLNVLFAAQAPTHTFMIINGACAAWFAYCSVSAHFKVKRLAKFLSVTEEDICKSVA